MAIHLLDQSAVQSADRPKLSFPEPCYQNGNSNAFSPQIYSVFAALFWFIAHMIYSVHKWNGALNVQGGLSYRAMQIQHPQRWEKLNLTVRGRNDSEKSNIGLNIVQISCTLMTVNTVYYQELYIAFAYTFILCVWTLATANTLSFYQLLWAANIVANSCLLNTE